MLNLTYDKQKTTELLTIGYLSGTLSIMQKNTGDEEFKAAYEQDFPQLLNSLKKLLDGKVSTTGIEKAGDVSEFVLAGFENDREATTLILIAQYYLLYEKLFKEAAKERPEKKDEILENGFSYVMNAMLDLPLEYVDDDISIAETVAKSDTFADFLQELVKYANDRLPP